MRKWVLTGVLLLPLLASCATISRQTRQQVDTSISFAQLHADPDRYMGKKVLLGGVIVLTTVQANETWVEVVQHPLDWTDRPKETDVSYGRFLIHFHDFRDPAVYAPGRRITVAGQVEGKKARMLQQVEYIYPVLAPLETYLWNYPVAGEPNYHIGIGIGVGGSFR